MSKYFKESNYIKGINLFKNGAQSVTIENEFNELKIINDIKYFKLYYKMEVVQCENVIVDVYENII